MKLHSILMLMVILTIAIFCEQIGEYDFMVMCDDITFVDINGTIIPIEVECE